MNVREVLAEIYRRNRVLALAGWFNLLLLVLMFCVAPFDARTVLGLNLWIKPMKFAVSFTVYLWTLAWLLSYLPRYPRMVRLISWGSAIVAVGEMFCIVSQAARGVKSHFNFATPYDSMIFTVMGLLIIFNTLLVALVLLLFFLRTAALPPAYLWGIRFGLLLFLLASLEGYAMISHGAHTIGMADGGPGLPFVNWSTRAGDLRAAHFLGFHALQLLPLAGYAVSRHQGHATRGQRVALVSALAVVYLATFSALFWQAMNGRPLLNLGAIF
ncbi:MAG: hypothetical protein ACR2GW_14755 [Pyrinomonadaceae bacterium]